MANIKIDDKDYELDNATDAAKAQLMHVQVIDAEIVRMKTLTAVMQTARGNYLRALKEELENPGSLTSQKPEAEDKKNTSSKKK